MAEALPRKSVQDDVEGSAVPPPKGSFYNREDSAWSLSTTEHRAQIREYINIFQASPLAYEDWSGKANPIPRLELEAEQTMLTEALNFTEVGLLFETATAEKLGRFLSEGNKFLHFSCHGNPDVLFIENDHGGAQTLLIDETLQQWIKAGGSQLSVVFVSACHSRNAGESFVKAGAKHVICCEQNSQLMSNTAAMVFSRQFYVSLANRKTVRQAFDMAVHMVRLAPEMKRTGLNVDEESQKFTLLPETGTDHNVSPFTFSPHSIPAPGSMESRESSDVAHFTNNVPNRNDRFSMLPIPPDNFFGRELEMYKILKALILQNSRLVRISGPNGIGKDGLARAIGHFVARRQLLGDTIWLPAVRKGTEGEAMEGFDRVMTLLTSSTIEGSKLYTDDKYREVQQNLMGQIYELKALVIINTSQFDIKTIERLGIWVDDMLEGTKRVKFLVVERPSKKYKIRSRRQSGFACTEHNTNLEPLDLKSTITLFGRICPHVLEDPKSWNPNELLGKKQDKMYKILGAGYPAQTIYIAKKMDISRYRNLMSRSSIREEDFAEALKEVQQTFGDDYDDEDDKDLNRSSRMLNGSERASRLAEFRPPLRSQIEVQRRFASLLTREGEIHRKCVTSYVRRAKKGEKIVTTIDGVEESVNVVSDDSSWVVCGKAAGEFYVLTNKNFQDAYDEDSGKPIRLKGKDSGPTIGRLRQRGFREYKSRRQVWARQATEADVDWFRYGDTSNDESDNGAYFVAPWGTSMRIEEGDYLVMEYPAGNDEIYRVEYMVFGYSYEAVDTPSAMTTTKKILQVVGTAALLTGVAGLVGTILLRNRPRR